RRGGGRRRGGGARGRMCGLIPRAARGGGGAGRAERGGPPPHGPSDPRSAGEAAAGFAAAAGWPVLADPLSGARRGGAAIAHYDALLRAPEFARRVRPDLVVRVGDLPTSKPLRSWLAGLEGAARGARAAEGAGQAPNAGLGASPARAPASALGELPSAPAAAEEDWLAQWRSADERASEAILGALGDEPLSEPAVAAELGV